MGYAVLLCRLGDLTKDVFGQGFELEDVAWGARHPLANAGKRLQGHLANGVVEQSLNRASCRPGLFRNYSDADAALLAQFLLSD